LEVRVVREHPEDREHDRARGGVDPLYLIIGASTIAVLILGWFIYGDKGKPGELHCHITGPASAICEVIR
jgi:hypothetical protein